MNVFFAQAENGQQYRQIQIFFPPASGVPGQGRTPASHRNFNGNNITVPIQNPCISELQGFSATPSYRTQESLQCFSRPYTKPPSPRLLRNPTSKTHQCFVSQHYPLQKPLAHRVLEIPLLQNPTSCIGIAYQHPWPRGAQQRCNCWFPIGDAKKKPTFRGGPRFFLGGSLEESPTFPPVRTPKTKWLRFGPTFRLLTLRPTCRTGNVATLTLRGLLRACAVWDFLLRATCPGDDNVQSIRRDTTEPSLLGNAGRSFAKLLEQPTWPQTASYISGWGAWSPSILSWQACQQDFILALHVQI